MSAGRRIFSRFSGEERAADGAVGRTGEAEPSTPRVGSKWDVAVVGGQVAFELE
jgi:hypothetical protein